MAEITSYLKLIFTETKSYLLAHMQESNFTTYWVAITIIWTCLTPDYFHLVKESRTKEEVLDPSAKVNVINELKQLLLKIK